MSFPRRRLLLWSLAHHTCCLLMSAVLPLSVSAAEANPPADPATEGRTVQLERLRIHSFASKRADDKAPGLLLGNARLGGCLAASGLGIPTLWTAELWSDTDHRLPLQGPLLSCPAFAGLTTASYHQELSLLDGVAKTSVRYPNDAGYDVELFASMADVSLLTLRLTPRGAAESEWLLDLPATPTVDQTAPTCLSGKSAPDAFTPFAWSLVSDPPLTRAAGNRFSLRLAPDQPVTLTFRLRADTPTAPAIPPENKTFDELLASHRAAWDSLWQRSAVLVLPDLDLERLWYRSLYWTLSTCGNDRFLPGESMFAVPCWDMHPFTYGAAGWAAQAFTSVGLPERAKAILDCHFKGAALRDNALFYTRVLMGDSAQPASPEAMAFAHEVKTDGRNIPCEPYELQRHLDGFAAALFQRHRQFYPDKSFSIADLYPLMKGLAESWCGLAQRDPKSGDYLLPKMTSLTEDLIAIHPIDAALAAKWCLMIARRDAVTLGLDAERSKHWQDVADHLHMPQNDQRYLEYSGDLDQRPGGGYQGVRGFVYLSYPTMELRPTLDRVKSMRTLDHTWERNLKGEGMIGFVANWFALADLHYGRGDHALEILKHNFRCEDTWKQGVSEFPGSKNYHFTTNYASYLLVPLAMAVQSVDDRLDVFSAVPSAWKNFAFYQVPAEAGLRVSGVMRDGNVSWITYAHDGKVLRQATDRESLRIERTGSSIRLKKADAAIP